MIRRNLRLLSILKGLFGGDIYEHETLTPMIPPTFLKESNFSANAADVAATIIVMIITTVECPRLHFLV